MTLDHDDLYTQRDAFSILYEEAERNNLDILEFSAMMGGLHLFSGQYIIGNKNTPVEFQPNICIVDPKEKFIDVDLLSGIIYSKQNFFKK